MDGAFDEINRVVGIGVVAKDHEGSFLMDCSLTVQHVYDLAQAEALAERLASQFSTKHDFGPARFDSYCLGMV